MSTDKRTIGVTSANERVLGELVLAGRFASEIDAAKFAMAYAIRQGTRSGSAESTNTKWNIGTVDPEGTLRSMVKALYSNTLEPNRLVEHFINEGLVQLDSGSGLPPDVAKLLFESQADD